MKHPRIHPALSSIRALILGVGLLLPIQAALGDDPFTVYRQGFYFRDLEWKSSGGPVISIPSFFGDASTPFSQAPQGENAHLTSAVVAVAMPATATATAGPFSNSITLTSFLGSVQLNASWAPFTDEEFLANCLVEGQGAAGFFGGGEGSEGIPVPLSGSFALSPQAYAFDFDYVSGFYSIPFTFTTGSSGGFLRGTVDVIYSAEELPIQVDTLSDVDDTNYTLGHQSLREALKRASNKTTPVTIPFKVGGTIEIANSPLTLTGANPNEITLLPLSGQITLNGGNRRQILIVPSGRSVSISSIRFGGGHANNEEGGAIDNQGTLNLANCLFFLNTTSDGSGGAIATAANASTTLRHCEFVSNHASSDGNPTVGGTLYIAPGGDLEAVNCLILNSQGAVYNQGTCALRHTTLFGGVTAIVADADSVTELSHCLVSSNGRAYSGAEDLSISTDATFTSQGWNAIESAPGSGFTPLSTDIINKPLQVISGTKGEVIPAAFSPCVNAGNPAFSPGAFSPSLVTDIYGKPRVDDVIDIGAAERESDIFQILDIMQTAPTGDENKNGTPDLIDGSTGVDPVTDQTSAPPVDVKDIVAAVGLNSHLARYVSASPPPSATVTLETRLDERITLATLTVQTSTDLMDWTDRVTYAAQGEGLGYTRTDANGVNFLEHEKSGPCWFIREQMPKPASGSLFVRMQANMIE